MRALSIRQPWVTAILRRATDPVVERRARWKAGENREWAFDSGNLATARRLIGETIYLHAAGSVGVGEFDHACESILDVLGTNILAEMFDGIAESIVPRRGKYRGKAIWTPAPALHFGGIVGRARLADVVRTVPGGHRFDLDGVRCLSCGRVPVSAMPPCPEADRWAVPGAVGLILADVEALPFVPFKGALGFFDVPTEVLR